MFRTTMFMARRIVVGFRLSRDEADELERAAAKQNLRVGTFVREMLMAAVQNLRAELPKAMDIATESTDAERPDPSSSVPVEDLGDEPLWEEAVVVEAVAQERRRFVAGRARDVPITAQDLVKEERLTKRHQLGILGRHRADRDHTPVRQILSQFGVGRGPPHLGKLDRVIAAGEHEQADRQREASHDESNGSAERE